MEIERKFLLKSLPDLKPDSRSHVLIGYVDTDPVVRIYSREELIGEQKGKMTYRMTIKGHGQLVRAEIECDIPANFFKKTAAFIGNDLIVKDYYVYTHNGHTLEVSLVDPGTENEFLYGEVEFESVEEAMAYEWPFEGAVDVTKDDSFKMNRYWERTRLR